MADDDDYYDAFDYFDFGLEFLQDDEFDKAIEQFNKALNAKRADELALSNLYYELGICYQAKEEDDKAISYFTKALDTGSYSKTKDEMIPELYYSRGLSYGGIENWAKASSDMKKAADLGHEKAKAFLREHGSVMNQMGNSSSSSSSTSSRSSSSSSASSYSKSTSSDRGGVIMSLVFAVACGLYISGMFSDSVNAICIITLVLGAVAGFLAWRFKKTILKIALIGLIILSFVLPRVNPSLLPKNWGLFSSFSANTVTVTADALNLRAEASGSAEIVKTLQNGAVLTVTGEAQNGWLPVSHEGSKGWVSSQFVE